MNKSLMVIGVALAMLAACGAPAGTGFTGTLSGAAEKPNPVTTSGTGTVTATLNGTTLTLTGAYSQLSGAPTAAHIHGPADANSVAGVLCNLSYTETAVGTGTLSASGAASNPCSSYAWTTQNIADLEAGKFYVNVHTVANAGGEVRAQLIKK